MNTQFRHLGKAGSQPDKKLDVFEIPEGSGVQKITFVTNEVTAFCPVTHQPDIYTVALTYEPARYGIESKSLKLYFWSFRDEAIFGEMLASQIASDVFEQVEPHWVEVHITQQVRGGLILSATAYKD